MRPTAKQQHYYNSKVDNTLIKIIVDTLIFFFNMLSIYLITLIYSFSGLEYTVSVEFSFTLQSSCEDISL